MDMKYSDKLKELNSYFQEFKPKHFFITYHVNGAKSAIPCIKFMMEGSEIKIGVNSRVVLLRDCGGSDMTISQIFDVSIKKSKDEIAVSLFCGNCEDPEIISMVIFV